MTKAEWDRFIEIRHKARLFGRRFDRYGFNAMMAPYEPRPKTLDNVPEYVDIPCDHTADCDCSWVYDMWRAVINAKQHGDTHVAVPVDTLLALAQSMDD